MSAEPEGKQLALSLQSFLYEAKVHHVPHLPTKQLGELVFARNSPEKQFAIGVFTSDPLWDTVDNEDLFGSFGGSLVWNACHVTYLYEE